jgi:thiol-disulfide isomerase/thioredoxin
VAALAVAVVTGLAWQRTNGRIRGVHGAPAPGAPEGRAANGPAAGTGPVLTGAELGLPLGQRATLVQFSTAFCAPCRATRRTLAEVAGMVDGVAHVEIDAESHLDLVRRLDIRRTPTVLVVGPDGRITKRASGQPRKADVIAAVGDLA